MNLIKRTNFDFIGKRRIAFFVSAILCLGVILGLAIFGLNLGVDFAGGTMVEVKFNHDISAEEIRRRAQRGGLTDVTVQGFGAAEENTYLLRMGGVTQLTPEAVTVAETAIRNLGGIVSVQADQANGLLNLRASRPLPPEQVREAVEKAGVGVKEVRSLGEAQGGGFDYQLVASGMADKVFQVLSEGQAQPDFSVQRVDYVGPQVGKQLRNRGVMAMIYALIAILVYVAFRFDFKFAPGALVAQVHDVILVLGYYLLTKSEFSLTAVAALLTVIGYSINDKIVIYDRVREEMARYRGKPLAEIVNIAVNATLSRTLLTGGIGGLSLVGLLVFGVGEIWDFAMAMVVGILVGTYSSIFIASPMTIWIDQRMTAKERGEHTVPKARTKTA